MTNSTTIKLDATKCTVSTISGEIVVEVTLPSHPNDIIPAKRWYTIRSGDSMALVGSDLVITKAR